MRPQSKFDRVVLADVLIETGLTLIREANVDPKSTALSRARQVRNGLMISLLGLCPIRLKNFAALEIGRSFVRIKDGWWIVLAASETKENRADERPLDPMLNIAIDCYLSKYRPILARTDTPPHALWLSSNDGAPMSYSAVEWVIKRTTLISVGVDVSPHLFRTSVASTAACRGGENPHLASALLNHSDANVTNEHYNRASSLSAAEKFRQIIRKHGSVTAR